MKNKIFLPLSAVVFSTLSPISSFAMEKDAKALIVATSTSERQNHLVELLQSADEIIGMLKGLKGEYANYIHRIEDQYESYRRFGFTSQHLAWMTIQASVIATLAGDGQVTAILAKRHWDALLEEERFIDPWGNSAIKDLECAKNIKLLTTFFTVIPEVNKGRFSKSAFLKGYARGIYSVSLNTTNALVHGGNYKSPFEILMHDIFGHGMSDFGYVPSAGAGFNYNFTEERMKVYRDHFLSLQKGILYLYALDLSELDRKKVDSVLYYAIHETDGDIWRAGEGDSLRVPRSDSSVEMYPLELREIIYRVRDSKKRMNLLGMTPLFAGYAGSGTDSYMREHRDVAFDLIQDGFAKREDLVAPGATKLGLTYNLSLALATIFEMAEWFTALCHEICNIDEDSAKHEDENLYGDKSCVLQ